AFIKLKSLPLPEHKSAAIKSLALNIFSQYKPSDPATRRSDCHNCGSAVKEWENRCGECGTSFSICIASGRSILDPDQHRFYNSELRGKRNCPLCHTPLQLGTHHGGSAVPDLNMDLRREHAMR
ncbi:MAG: hypothetical protein SGPRY_014380, partial [Prymnesium sp.]